MIPVLYSFRRCPYAIRARLALRLSQQKIILREILLKDKPMQMLSLSSKGTVPVLQVESNTVLDESIDIAYWALHQNDPQNYLPQNEKQILLTNQLIDQCDGDFKHYLDRYKYADRFPEYPAEYYRQQTEVFLSKLNSILNNAEFLLDNHPSLVDIAVFPFIRQFAAVDKAWFDQTSYTALQHWLQYHLDSELFQSIMHKVPVWKPDQTAIYL